jgi:hypothetical protein
MAQLAQALRLLEEFGVRAGMSGADTILWDDAVGHHRARASTPAVPPTPSRVDHELRQIDLRSRWQGVLYVVDRATSSLVQRALDDPRVNLAIIGQARLILGGVDRHRPVDRTLSPRRGRGRIPWARYAVARVLIRTGRPRTQVALAHEAGVTQQAVAKALPVLEPYGVVRERDGWTCADPTALWRHYLGVYPGSGGLRRGWVGVAPLVEQVERTRDAAAGIVSLDSGDTAADAVAPWRRPVRSTVYATDSVDLSARFSLADDRSRATLVLAVPADPTVFATARAWADGDARRTDPLITAWEMLDAGGPDVAEAVDHLRRAVLDRREERA